MASGADRQVFAGTRAQDQVAGCCPRRWPPDSDVIFTLKKFRKPMKSATKTFFGRVVAFPAGEPDCISTPLRSTTIRIGHRERFSLIGG